MLDGSGNERKAIRVADHVDTLRRLFWAVHLRTPQVFAGIAHRRDDVFKLDFLAICGIKTRTPLAKDVRVLDREPS